jgi:hypothetical protein
MWCRSRPPGTSARAKGSGNGRAVLCARQTGGMPTAAKVSTFLPPPTGAPVGRTSGDIGRCQCHTSEWFRRRPLLPLRGRGWLGSWDLAERGVLEPVREQGLLAEDFHAGEPRAADGSRGRCQCGRRSHILRACLALVGRMAWWAGSGRLVLVTVDGLICASTLAGEPHECCPVPPMSGHLTFRSGILTLVS